MSNTKRSITTAGVKSRDGKPWWKPDSWYKRMLQRLRRARAKQAIREGKEPEKYKREDGYEWT